MMVWVHAAVGACVGARLKSPTASFAAGALSHLVCDLIPHKDYELAVEAPLAAAMLLTIGARYGVRSPQFVGALGGIAPDIENGLAVLGAITQNQTIFPTHNSLAPWFVGHGGKVSTPWPQVVLAAAALVLASLADKADE
jgi:hypothetical protein